MGARRAAARGGRAARRPGDRSGRARLARELGRRARRRLDRSSGVAGAGEARQHLACTSIPHGELRAVYRKVHMFDVEVGGRVYRESELEQPGEEIVLSRDRRRRRAGAVDLLRPALPRALPDPRRARARGSSPLPGGVHAGDHARPLGDAVRARAIENQAFVIAANQIGAHPGGQHSGGRSMIVDPWGLVLAQAPDARGPHRRRARPRAPARDPRAAARRWPTAARAPTAGRRRCAHERRQARRDADDAAGRATGRPRARATAPDKRRLILDAAVRVFARQGFHACRVVGHRRRGGRRLRPRLPLLRLQGRGARHAVPRALERDARADPRGRRRAAPGAREARRDRLVHRRQLPATTPT